MRLRNLFSVFKVDKLSNKTDISKLPEEKVIAAFPSLNLAFELIKEQLIAQQEQADALDTKANAVLVAGTALVSAALVLQSLLLPSHSHIVCTELLPNDIRTLPVLLKRIIPLLPLLITYLEVVGFSISAYRVRDYAIVPKPRQLFDKYLDKAEETTKGAICLAMVSAYEKNKDENDKKAEMISCAFGVLVIETIFFIFLLLYQVAC